MDIRTFTDADFDATVALMRDGGWGDRRIQLGFVRGLPEARILVADDGGPLVANGLGSKHGDTGWIGLIFVAPDQRGRGLGAAITSAVADHLEARGCTTLVLIATEMGRPVYERLGFAAEVVYQEWEGTPRTAPPADPRPRRATPADLPGMARLDRDVTGEDRRASWNHSFPVPGFWMRVPRSAASSHPRHGAARSSSLPSQTMVWCCSICAARSRGRARMYASPCRRAIATARPT